MDIKKVLKEIIRIDGYPIHMDTAFCRAYRESHSNCIGCESELGCKKFIDALLIVAVQSIEDGEKWQI